MVAASNGCIGAVNQLLGSKQVGKQNSNGMTALMMAVSKNRIDVVRVLSEKTEEINKTDAKGDTALMYAIRNNSIEAAKILMETKEVNTKTSDGKTPIMLASELNKGEILRLLLCKSKSENKKNENTPLMIAAQEGNYAAAKALKDSEDVGKKNAYGETALMLAVLGNHPEIVELLITEAGMQDNNGTTAMMLAVENGKSDIIKMLMDKESGLQNNEGETALIMAVDNENTEIVSILKNSSDVGKQNNQGYTALMIAAKNGYSDITNILMKTKEFGMQNKFGITASMLAAKNCYPVIVRQFRNEGTEIGKQDINGFTALMYATLYIHRNNSKRKIIDMLNDEKNIKNNNGETNSDIENNIGINRETGYDIESKEYGKQDDSYDRTYTSIDSTSMSWNEPAQFQYKDIKAPRPSDYGLKSMITSSLLDEGSIIPAPINSSFIDDSNCKK